MDDDELRIRVPVRAIFDRMLWDAYCDVSGTNVWAINEGRLSITDEVSLTLEDAERIGLLTPKRGWRAES